VRPHADDGDRALFAGQDLRRSRLQVMHRSILSGRTRSLNPSNEIQRTVGISLIKPDTRTHPASMCECVSEKTALFSCWTDMATKSMPDAANDDLVKSLEVTLSCVWMSTQLDHGDTGHFKYYFIGD